MILAEDVLPAAEWLAKHPNHKGAQRLAAKVSAKHPVEIGMPGAGASGTGSQPDDAEGYLHIEEIKGVKPLDSQFGVHPPKTVPDVLYQPLFGQPDPTPAEVAQYGGADKVPPLGTYAVLDAAKVVNFVEMLEASGLEHRCLFKGEAAEEMRDVAPYVVRLEEDVDFTRNLFSHDPEQEVPWFMWEREPGIYLRSRGTLDEMWKHFRKFTKVQDEDGKWYYFRFWEGESFAACLSYIAAKSEHINTWFNTQNGKIHSILAQQQTLSGCSWLHMQPLDQQITYATASTVILSKGDIKTLSHTRFKRDVQNVIAGLAKAFPERVAARTQPENQVLIEQIITQMRRFNIRQKNNLFIIAAWEIHFGPNFLNVDNKLGEIPMSTGSEPTKMQALHERMAELPSSTFTRKGGS